MANRRYTGAAGSTIQGFIKNGSADNRKDKPARVEAKPSAEPKPKLIAKSIADKYKAEEKETARHNLYMKPSTFKAIDDIAKAAKVSRNKVINDILEEALEGK